MDISELYNWFGANEALFKIINGFHTDIYDTVMILLSQIADKHNVPYYFGALVIWAAVHFMIRVVRKNGNAKDYFIRWLAVLLVLGISFAADALVVKTVKEELSYPRPYVALSSQDVHVLEYQKEDSDNYHSFPSGHVSVITVLVVSLWPVLTEGGCMLGIILIPLVCLSRIAVGFHFPADVLGGFVIALIITLFVQAMVRNVLRILRIR